MILRFCLRHAIPVAHFSALIFISLFLACSHHEGTVQPLTPGRGDHIIFIGNTFAERMREFNYFETLLYESFPNSNLTVRNLGWSADEVALQPRPLNFGTLDQHLLQQKADIIFACFGINESYKGADSVESFKKQLSAFLQHLQQQKYDGQKTPRIILVSPIAHEKLGGLLPDPAAHNTNLALYTDGMKEVAAALHVSFIDLFEPTKELEAADDSITINGIHLNDKGYHAVSELMARTLGFPVSSCSADAHFDHLKKVIDQKNQQFFYLFRAVNGEYIYGRRKEPWVQPPGGPISFPGELKKLDGMVKRLDSVVWAETQKDDEINVQRVSGIVDDTIQFRPLVNDGENRKPSSASFVLPEGYQINLFASEIEFPMPIRSK